MTKFNLGLKSLLLSMALFASLSSYASDPVLVDTSPVADLDTFTLTRPEFPENFDLRSLPSTSTADNKLVTNCSAIYRIDKYELWKTPGRIAFQIVVKNLGDCTLKNITVKDFFPNYTNYRNASPTPLSRTAHEAMWRINWLAGGHEAHFNIVFDLNPPRPSRWVTNNACAWNALIGQKICAWITDWVEARP